ncbi:protein LURP-one-related 8-like [Malania oleifera]|uniref:protein LURP-one-related 8-like n=1 Tax=Malania oleifera TaxID=397392 RepID=UPI0025AE0312|nr:protein LURP-one-related 8-like [Malania oleifera]
MASSKHSPPAPAAAAAQLTIWNKSLLFNGHGYTVYDNSSGRLIFRVENYACDRREEMFLMDAAGNVLFTLRRTGKKLSMLERWEAFKGDYKEAAKHQKPLIRAKKLFGIPCCKVSMAAGAEYEIRWSRQQGWSKIYSPAGGGGGGAALPIAEVCRKCCMEAPALLLGKDVFTLIVQPEVDQATVMAMLMINDAMSQKNLLHHIWFAKWNEMVKEWNENLNKKYDK